MPMGIQKTFEENMEEMSRMSPEQVQARIKGFEKICICVECPTYIGTGEKKLVFCTLGKSTIITKDKGCLCCTSSYDLHSALVLIMEWYRGFVGYLIGNVFCCFHSLPDRNRCNHG